MWHEVLSRLSNRHVELFCERRYVALTGEWTGTVTWDGGDGDATTVTGPELEELAARRSPGRENPDGAFVRAVREGGGAWPAIGEAVRAHRVVDAAYRSAADDGMPVEVPPIDAHDEERETADGRADPHRQLLGLLRRPARRRPGRWSRAAPSTSSPATGWPS